MKILFVSEYYLPLVHGGAEISASNLASKLSSEKVQVIVAVPNIWKRGPHEESNIKIIAFPFPVKVKKNHQIIPNWIFFNPLYWLWECIWLVKFTCQQRIDIIHVQSRNSIPGAVLAAKMCRKPIVATFRDWQILCNYGVCISTHPDGLKCSLRQYFANDFRTYYRDKVISKNLITLSTQLCFALYNRFILSGLQFFAKRLDAIICISDFQKGIYEKNGFRNVSRIYNIEKFIHGNLIANSKNFVFGGRATSGKGLPMLLDAMKSVLATDNSLRLIVVGGNDRCYFKLLKQLRIEKSVEFVGWIYHTDMTNIYSQALAVVQPSVFPEPFGRMALEGLAHGLPVVVTWRGGLPEIVENNVTGYVVEPEVDSLAKALIDISKNNEKFRKNIKKDYRQLKNKFEIEPVIQHINLYQSFQ